MEYRRATYKKTTRFAIEFFVLQVAQFKESEGFFCQRATYKGNVQCVLNWEFPFFLVHKYWGSEATRLSWSNGSYENSSTKKPCAKAVLETDTFTQQKQYHKWTTLCMFKLPLRSIRNEGGLHYRLGAKRKEAVIKQAINAIYGMGTLKIPLQSIGSKAGLHYHLWAKREEAVIRQATINLFTSLDILWWFHTRAVLRSLANARKCQLKDFCEEERYESCSVPQTFTADTFRKIRKRENSMVVMLLPGSHECLALRDPHVLFQKHGGTCTMY